MFKDSFKYYKSRNPLPDLKNVLDFDNLDCNKVIRLNGHLINEQCVNELGLIPLKQWKIYELQDIPGLIFIRNPFTTYGQQYWIIKCLKDYTKKPTKLNLDTHNILNENEHWWDICFGGSSKANSILPKLRWATLGYHHNWDTKLYSENYKTEMPNEISSLTSTVANALGFTQFRAEAVIVNYYRMKSTLAGHTDHSEMNINAPLFSISFGQTAIFLIGGHTQEDAATAIYLRSGDIVAMSGKSRLRYHGVPKILSSTSKPWEQMDDECKKNPLLNYDDWNKAKTYITEARINMNVRQVLKVGQVALY